MRNFSPVICMLLTLGLSVAAKAQPLLEKAGYELEAENFYLQGIASHDNGQLELAANYYSQAVNADPRHTKALYNLALVQYDLGNFGESASALEKLFAATPADKGAYELYGLALYQLGHYDRAIASYEMALQAGPSDHILVNKALAYAKTGRPKAALHEFDKAFRLNPSNFNACLGKGIALMGLGQLQLAVSWLNHALALRPDDALALSNRAIAYFSMDEKEKAMEDFSAALSKSRNSEIYIARAKCRLKEGHLEDAYYDAREALLLAPNREETHQLLGEIEWKRGNLQTAIHHYNLVLDSNPDCKQCYLQLAQINLEEKRYYDAISYLYQLSRMNPLDKEARALLNSAYNQLDRYNLDQMARTD